MRWVVNDERRYLFAPLEQRGLVAGLRTGQVMLLAGGLVVAVASVRSLAPPGGVVVAAAAVAAALSAAFIEVRGRPAEQWAPVLVRFGTQRARRRHRTTARPGPAGWPVPQPLRHLRFDELHRGPAGGPLAIVTDGVTGESVAVLSARGRSFALLDAADKERRLASWAGVLAALAREGGPVTRVQWVERTVGGDGDALSRHLAEARTLPVEAAPTRSYDHLVSEAGPLTQDHECFVVLSVRRGVTATALQRELRLLEGQLRSADVDVRGGLGLRQLGEVLRTAYDPGARTPLARRAAAVPDQAGAPPGAAWPAATESSWASYRTDTAWHATFWVAEWPRAEVGADFLGPLLVQAGFGRTVALTMAPASASEGFREAESARAAAAADEELRQRAGFLATARRRREAEGLARRESELSDGHAAYRFSGYVTVSAASPEGLEDACAETVQLAHQCRLDLRRLFGIQDLAFTWTLPLARGLA